MVGSCPNIPLVSTTKLLPGRSDPQWRWGAIAARQERKQHRDSSKCRRLVSQKDIYEQKLPLEDHSFVVGGRLSDMRIMMQAIERHWLPPLPALVDRSVVVWWTSPRRTNDMAISPLFVHWARLPAYTLFKSINDDAKLLLPPPPGPDTGFDLWDVVEVQQQQRLRNCKTMSARSGLDFMSSFTVVCYI